MLGTWRTHEQYQLFMITAVNREFRRNHQSIAHYEKAILKMYHMNLDTLKVDFMPLFSSMGRPSHQQPEIFRSFVLMSHFKFASLEAWLAYAKSSIIISALIGVTPCTLPGESTHRDFYSRLWQMADTNRLRYAANKSGAKPNGGKLLPKNPGIVKKLVDKAMSGEVFERIPERLLQAIFTKVAVLPSAAMGLLGDTKALNIVADGTCVASNASPFGKRICECTLKCGCLRKFSDPLSKWGWDSYEKRWFYGYTAYLLSVHNPNLKLDLPIYIKFAEAYRHDSVTLIAALSHAKYLYKDILRFDSLTADSAHDNYPTYTLLKEWGIKPFIDLNKRSADTFKRQDIKLDRNGIPTCIDGHNMVNWGFEAKKYRIKYRCPLKTGRIKWCPFDEQCNKTNYGKTYYLKLVENLRLLTPVPRNTAAWKQKYNQRTAAERVNNRILTDYGLIKPKRYGKKKLAFFTFISAINVHLDAQIKYSEISFNSLLTI